MVCKLFHFDPLHLQYLDLAIDMGDSNIFFATPLEALINSTTH